MEAAILAILLTSGQGSSALMFAMAALLIVSAPVMTVLGIIVAIAAGFRRLIRR